MDSSDGSVSDIFQPGGGVDLDVLSREAVGALRESLRLARATRWDSVRSPHVFMGLLSHPDAGVRFWGERLDTDLPGLLRQFKELFFLDEGEPDALLKLHREFLSDNVIRLLRGARLRAAGRRRALVTTLDLLICTLSADNSIVAECFERFGVSASRLTGFAVQAEQRLAAR